MNLLINANAKHIPLADNSVNCVVTSPPYYGLRDYGAGDQIGLEQTPDDYVNAMVQVFREVWRVLRDDGTVWLNLGDSYASSGEKTTGRNDPEKYGTDAGGKIKAGKTPGLKPKDLIGIPWRVAFALQADGWWLRQDIIWHKPNPMPESVKDRCTKAHEYIFLLTKSARYWYDHEAIKEDFADERMGNPGGGGHYAATIPGQEPHKGLSKGVWNENGATSGRNKRSVCTVTTKPYPGSHYAVFPPDLIEPCVLAGCPEGGTVLDPFAGSGTTLMVARKHRRNAIGLDLNFEYLTTNARERLQYGSYVPVADGINQLTIGGV